MKTINKNLFSARRLPDRIHYRFLKCLKCGLIFSDPILSSSKIEGFYKKSDFNYSSESDYLKKVYFKYLTQEIRELDKNANILEIGCGNGFFMDELYKRGYKNIYGVEPGKKSVDKASRKIKKNIRINIFKKGLFAPKRFDLVLSFHTLDHVVDLSAFLKEVNAVLKKGGKLFFVVHDTDGLSVRLFGEKSPIFDLEHIFLFNKNSLSNIIGKNNFGNISTFSIINEYPIYYWARLFPMPKGLKRFTLALLSWTRIGKVSFFLSAGNIGVVASKQ